MAEHTDGQSAGGMDIAEQQRTYGAFVKGITWLAGASAVILIFLALFNS
ncbi:aa3-type cytochrome c oxidase subunit IV [Paroceanicella profunda]|uniref:Aa3-type cytochrome c oxidase subunit IV n=1 Tax=Paroceanicella profunda TaxID=2579971 RepID=A0A5B8FXL7_9RHOB|nr:aa3-type cytochrome c oxidase subunit IV [Paroceanicella profunda]QDL91970.1 aa3-type cytochrome c oxidase subunit IV [Paroceanicella profunda]